jgi:hypothetical protein
VLWRASKAEERTARIVVRMFLVRSRARSFEDFVSNF